MRRGFTCTLYVFFEVLSYSIGLFPLMRIGTIRRQNDTINFIIRDNPVIVLVFA
jgi:hypothetical protein